MGYIEGLLGGFTTRRNDVFAENLRAEELAHERESAIYNTLLSSPDPEMRSLALTSLLDTAGGPKRAKGLRGFMSEVDRSSNLPAVRRLMQTPVTEQRRVPSGQQPRQFIPTPPPSDQPAAQAETSPTTGGAMAQTQSVAGQLPPQAPPLGEGAPISAAGEQPRFRSQNASIGPPPQVAAAPPLAGNGGQPTPPPGLTQPWNEVPPFDTVTTTRPREVFRSPEGQARANTAAQSAGSVEGEIAGLVAAGVTPERAQQAVLQKYERLYGGTAGMTFAEGEVIPDSDSPTGYSQILYQRADPSVQQRIPAQPPTALTRSSGADRDALARELYGGPFAGLTQAQQADVNAQLPDRTRALALERGRGSGQAQIETELGKPIGITAGAEQGLSPTTPLSAFEGIVPITTEQRGRLEAAKLLEPQVQTIETLISDVFPPQSGIIGGITASSMIRRKRLANDPQLAQLEAQLNLALGNVARVLAAESGRLTEQDAERARTALADIQGFTDTRESALAKIAIVNEALANIARDIRTPAQQMQDRQGSASTGGRLVVVDGVLTVQ